MFDLAKTRRTRRSRETEMRCKIPNLTIRFLSTKKVANEMRVAKKKMRSDLFKE